MVCLLSLCSFTEAEESIAAEAGIDAISHEAITKEELAGEQSISLWNKLVGLLQSGLSAALGDAFAHFTAIAGILLLCSLLHALQTLSDSRALADACSFITALALAGVSYSCLYGLVTRVGQAVACFTEYLAALLPVSGSLLLAGGSTAAAAASGAGMSAFLSAVELICSSVLFPFLQVSFALSLAGALPGTVNLTSINSLVRNTASVLLAFLFSLLGFLLSMQTSIASASDSYLFRSVRFASGLLIPVVGGALGDAARTIAGSVSVIKGTVGAVGTVATLAILLPPFLSLLANRFALSLCGALAGMLGCEREGSLLRELSSTLSVLLGLLAGTEAVALLYLAIFVRTNASV